MKKNIIIKKRAISTLLALVIGYSSYGFACNSADKTRQLAKAEDTIAESELRVATFLTDAKTNGVLSQADINIMKPYLLAVNDGNRNAISITKELLTNLSADKQTELLAAISSVSVNLTRLDNEGVLRIKDPTKRLVFSGFILALQGAVSSAVVLLVKK